MKQILLFLLLISWNSVFSQNANNKTKPRLFKLSSNIKSADYLPNTIIVKYKKTPVIFKDSTAVNNPILVHNTAKILSVKKKFPISGISSRRTDESTKGILTQGKIVDLGNICEVKFTGNAKIEDVINELLQDTTVEYAEPSYIFHTYFAPNDPLYSDTAQSYLRQVKAPQAWNLIKNASNVVIAIVDNGSDLTHEDLASNIYLNNADPANGIDDDKDGYIDNYYGWDLGGSSIANPEPDNDPNVKSAAASHGVHVSGLASAVSDNKIGISSIAFNAKLLVIKAAADDDPENIYRGYEGIKYAADHGAQIINCSWGSNAGGAYGQDIINYALSKNCLIVAAAGNDNTSNLIYPAAYPGVFAVANLDNSDKKAPTSSFGDYISISAPGTNILSTIYHNQYAVLSGTSMSAPIVSSAAALVKSYFPSLTMQQVGERLRVTADKINDKNVGLEGLLGSGRLNVYNALTVVSPSIRNQKLTISSNKAIAQGDTIQVYLDLKNFLAPALSLSLGLVTNSPFITILNPEINAGDINTLQTKTLIGPFNLVISPVAPDNSVAEFQIKYSANDNKYQDSEGFSIPMGLDYLNVQVNNISTTMTSNGRVGFNNTNASNGLGFIYKNHNLLFEASLIIGNLKGQVSDNARNDNGTDEDFIKKVRVKRINSITGEFEGKSEFNDSASTRPLNIYIKHRQLAYSKAPDDKYSIVEYNLINKNAVPIEGIYIGLFTDWDIDLNAKDVTRYDPFNRIGYNYGKFGKGVYGGVKLLSTSGAPLYYPLSVDIPGNPLSNGFSRDEKYKTLSKGIQSLSMGDNSVNGVDVAFVTGYGPYKILPNDSIKVAFALLAGDDLTDLENSAKSAQEKYSTFSTDRPYFSDVVLKQNYPNPANSNTLIQFTLPDEGFTRIDVFDINGHKVTSLINGDLQSGSYAVNMDVLNIPAGIYVYRLQHKTVNKALKMIVSK